MALDEPLFDKTLEYALKTPAESLPEARLANSIAKKKAEWLKANKDKFWELYTLLPNPITRLNGQQHPWLDHNY